MKRIPKRKSLLAGALALSLGAVGLFSCEDDEIVTPIDNNGGGCTGSYCELDMNKSPMDIVYVPKANPETF